MHKKLFSIIALSAVLVFLGVYFYAPDHIASQRTVGPLNQETLGANNEVLPVVAKPGLPKNEPARSKASNTPEEGSNFTHWPDIVPKLLKKSLQATSSRRPPLPPASRDVQRQNAELGGSDQQKSSNSSAKKVNSPPGPPVVSDMAVRCNVKRPSCRRWLHLQQKKLRRKNTLAVRETSR